MAKSSFLQEGTTNLANEYRFTGGKREGERKEVWWVRALDLGTDGLVC